MMSLFYYIDRILWVLLLLGVGFFCFYKMVTVKPHKLKKERLFQVCFRSYLPNEGAGEMWYCFSAAKGNLARILLF